MIKSFKSIPTMAKLLRVLQIVSRFLNDPGLRSGIGSLSSHRELEVIITFTSILKGQCQSWNEFACKRYLEVIRLENSATIAEQKTAPGGQSYLSNEWDY